MNETDPYIPPGTLILPKSGDKLVSLVLWSSPPWMSKGRKKAARLCFDARFYRMYPSGLREITNAVGLPCDHYNQPQRYVYAE